MYDLKFAVRQLLKNPGFTAVAVLTLALGIGANTAIFSLFNSIALRPLPVPEADRVVNLHQSFRGVVSREVHASTLSAFSYPEFAAYRGSKSFVGLAAYVGRSLILDGPEPERIRGTLVSGSYFSTLQAKTVAGRTFGGQEAEGKDALPLAVLGDGFSRLIRMLLVESLVLALLGGIVAVLLSTWILGAWLPLLVSAIGQDPSALALNIAVDWNVLGIALLVSLVATLAVGLVPALQATQLNLATAVKEQGFVFGLSVSRSRLRNGLVVVQVAISLVLLVGAGLILRSLQKAQSIELGYATKDVIAVSIDLATRNDDSKRVTLLNRQFAERAQTLSGVRTVATAASTPLSGYNQTSVAAEGRGSAAEPSGPIADYNEVSGSYFEVLRMPLLRGRGFTEAETRTRAPVAVISQSMAHRLWPEQNPLGKRFTKATSEIYYEVIGVVRDVVNSSDLSRANTPCFYLPLSLESGAGVEFLIRCDSDAGALVPLLREIAREIDPNALFSAHRLEEYLERSIAPARMGAALASGVGALALLLSI